MMSRHTGLNIEKETNQISQAIQDIRTYALSFIDSLW